MTAAAAAATHEDGFMQIVVCGRIRATVPFGVLHVLQYLDIAFSFSFSGLRRGSEKGLGQEPWKGDNCVSDVRL